MKTLEQIINIAALGNVASKLNQIEFNDFEKPTVNKILSLNTDNEDKFLKLLALSVSTYESGSEIKKYSSEDLLPPEKPETQEFISISHANRLVFLLKENKTVLLNYALKRFANTGKILPHSHLKTFIDSIFSNNSLEILMQRLLVWPLLGNRGKWLIKIFKLSDFKWDSANIQDRLAMLKAMKSVGNLGYLSIIEKNWDKTSVENKIDYITTINPNNKEDISFLERVLEKNNDKKLSRFITNKIKDFSERTTPEKAIEFCNQKKYIPIEFINILDSEDLENLSYSFDLEPFNKEINFFLSHKFTVLLKRQWGQNFSEKFISYILSNKETTKTDVFAQKISVVLHPKINNFLSNYRQNNGNHLDDVFVSKIMVYNNIIANELSI